MFLNDVGQMLTTALAVTTTAQLLASADVQSRSRCGRNTIEIYNTGSGDVFIGNKDVTATTGLPIKAGTTKIIPVNRNSEDSLYIIGSAAGTVILAEYFA